MSYYRILGLNKEPFSTSPDPEFFYESRGHKAALTNLIIEMRLRRGLSVILGDVGAGKTTLSRKLIQALSAREGFNFHIIFDPTFPDENIFLYSLARIFGIESVKGTPTNFELKEALEHFLYRKGVEENKTVVLVIDEAQKLNETTLEALRILLNFETNEFKLLQVVLLGQLELHSRVINIPNLIDRVSYKYTINPLDVEEVHQMIDFRLRQAGYELSTPLFTNEAIKEVHRYTKGYPRQIGLLCHKALKEIIMRNRAMVDDHIIKDIVREEIENGWGNPKANVNIPIIQK
ncbi:MAG: AAA family ATPase [Candidatus Brocadiia bacterium]